MPLERMVEVRLSIKARRDLKDIWRFGRQQWGEAQADTYARALAAAMDLLAEQPRVGISAELALPNGRRWKVGAHHIYYRLEGPVVRIVRILSAKQDPARHLP